MSQFNFFLHKKQTNPLCINYQYVNFISKNIIHSWFAAVTNF
jgi:hypothetical protein